MADFSSEKCAMSAVSEASLLCRRVAEPRPVGDSVKAAIARATTRLGFAFNRTRDIWYGHARRIDAEEMDRLRECAERNEARIAVNNLLVLRGRLTEADEDFHRATIAALDDALRAMGAPVGSLAIREEG